MKTRCLLFFNHLAIILSTLSIFCKAAYAEVELNKNIKSLSLNSYFQYYISENSSDEQAIVSGAFEQKFSPLTKANFGFTSQTIWLALTVKNTDLSELDWVLSFPYALLDRVEVFYFDDSAVIQKKLSGSSVSHSLRQQRSRDISFLFTLPASSSKKYYIKIDSTHSMQIGAFAYTAEYYTDQTLKENFVYALFFGGFLIMAVYNLSIAFSTRSYEYFYYSLIVIFSFCRETYFSGTSYQFFFPMMPEANERFGMYSFLLSGIVSNIYIIIFFNLNKSKGFIYYLLTINNIFYLSYMLLYPVLGYLLIIKPMSIQVIINSSIVLIISIYLFKNGYYAARFFILAWFFLLFAYFITATTSQGLLPTFAFTKYSNLLGQSLEIIFLSFALSDKINILRKEKNSAIMELNRGLEEKVKARTEEINAVMLQLAEQKKEVEKSHQKLLLQNEQIEAAHKNLKELDHHKTIFFQNISHEIRTPLTLIMNPLEQALTKSQENHFLKVAYKNAVRLYRLVNQLLDFQKYSNNNSSLKLSQIELSAFLMACTEYVDATCRSKEITFQTKISSVPIYIKAHHDSVEKIVFNFLSNAIKYTPPGGFIELGLITHEDFAQIYVQDSGPGIEKSQREAIFQVFSQIDNSSTREYEGTGIGLALVKELAQKLGGSVGVDSELGRGSKFWCKLPLSDGQMAVKLLAESAATNQHYQLKRWHFADLEAEDLDENHSSQQKTGDGELVLIIDDLASMRSLIRHSLEKKNYKILTASNGLEGLELTRSQKPALIISDWMMPKMTGPQFIEEIQKDPALAGIPVILLTAKSDEESRLYGTEKGASAYLGKPFNEVELLSLVENLLKLKREERKVAELNRYLSENILKRFLPKTLVQEIVEGNKTLEESPKNATSTILFSDICSFTSIAEKIPPDKLALILNQYLTSMAQIIFKNDGIVDKFIGDAVMAIFGAPEEMAPAVQAKKAIKTALEMQAALQKLNLDWARQGLPAFKMRIGIHIGPVIVGSFGSAERTEYTAVGHTVNLASRIEAVAEADCIYFSAALKEYVSEYAWEEAGNFKLKGIDSEVTLYKIRNSKQLAA